MRFPAWLAVYGDKSYKGKCREEWAEQVDFVAWMRLYHQDYAAVMVHPKMEGRRSWGQIAMQKKDGSINRGASDIVIPACPPFVCEIKRTDHRKSKWQPGQIDYLDNAKKMGAWVCVGLGFDGAKLAFNDYLKSTKKAK